MGSPFCSQTAAPQSHSSQLAQDRYSLHISPIPQGSDAGGGTRRLLTPARILRSIEPCAPANYRAAKQLWPLSVVISSLSNEGFAPSVVLAWAAAAALLWGGPGAWGRAPCAVFLACSPDLLLQAPGRWVWLFPACSGSDPPRGFLPGKCYLFISRIS